MALYTENVNSSSSGGSGFFFITLYLDNESNFSIDKTYAEILEAIENGYVPIVKYAYNGKCDYLYIDRNGVITIAHESDMYTYNAVTFFAMSVNEGGANPATLYVLEDGTLGGTVVGD